MEEIHEGVVKSTASGSANAKPNNNQELALALASNREEGELSASDDDENPVSSGAQSTGTVTPSAGTIFATAASNTEGTLMAKTADGNNISSSVDNHSRSSIQPNNQKSFEKNRVTFSGNRGWFPNSTNNSLVISFSDDDSGSGSEDSMHGKTFEIKSDATVVKNSGRPPASSLIKSNKLRETARHVNKVMPQKLPSHRTFISSMSKARGGANSKNAGLFSVEQGSRVRNFNTLNKSLGNQERGNDQEVGWKNSKLQDLRHQIALRESELKLKAAQQNKDLAVVSCTDCNAMNLSNDVARKYQSTSAHAGQSEQKEPDRKRVKVSGSYTHRPTSDGQRKIAAAKSVMPAKEPTVENSSLHDRNMVDRGQKDIPTSRVELSIAKRNKQDGKRIDVLSEHMPSAVKDVADISSSCNQFEKDSRPVDPCVISSKIAPQANMTSSTSLKNLDGLALNHPRKVGEHHPSNSEVNKATGKHNEMNSVDYHKAISGDKTAEPSFNNLSQVNNVSMWNCLSDVNVSGHSNMDIQSILDVEELLDKELEEAQEHRRMCEIEERNALKVYRKAQRALIEANAGCSKLYRQRELCSARFRTFIMDDSNLLWSSRPHEPVGNQLDLSNHISQNIIPMSSHQLQPGYDVFNRQEYDPSIQCPNDASLNAHAPYQHANRQNLGSEPCSEPDASTSEPLPHNSKNAVNRLSSQSNEFNASADEDEETFPLDHESVQPNYEYQRRKHISDGGQMGTNIESSKKLSTQDPLLLEATLRSELFARLGKRTLPKISDSFNAEHSIERGLDNEIGSDKMQTSNGSFLSSEGGQNHQHDTGGTDKPERSSHETPIQIQVQDQCLSEKNSSKFHSTADPKENECPIRVHCSISELSSPPLVLRSTFDHLKVGSSISMSDQTENQQNHMCTLYIEEGTCVNSNEIQDNCLIANSKEETAMVYFGNKIGSYTSNLALDPFWPICMYELRGKCNNDECPWQHVKDFSNENMYQHRHDDSDSADCQVGLTIHQQNCDGATKLSKFQNILTPPMYIISLDMLKADSHSHSHSHESLVARRHGQCWRKCFSMSLALSSMFQKDLHTSDGRIEVHNGWSGQSSYFQSRNGVMNQLKQALLDKVQSVEMALLIINQEASKVDGVKKALSVLSRALETDRTSESLWIIYLLIYYGGTMSVGKDDMFSYAVKNNEGSYILWLMYINSRIQLDDRFVAYHAALSALCRHASAPDGDEINASACILDLFLQMVECLCMSGNIEKAIQRISGFFLAATKSNEPYSLMLSDILTCLTFSDKLIFWVCCVYLIIYRKLPDAVAQQFECKKELLLIEWPFVHLVDGEKQRAVKLVGTVVDSVESGINSESLKDEINLRTLQCFAICHIRCMEALDGLECSRNLLDKYIKLYPSCLELVLMSARLQKHVFGDFRGFEEALINWPKEVSGIQCIWNQYAEYALQSGRTGFAKELMDRWFHSIWKVKYPQYVLDDRGGDISNGLPESTMTSYPDISVSDKNQMDVMFGFLNLSLHNLLQNDRNEAWLAIERALKVAAPENFKLCVRGHAMFLHTYESRPKEDALISWQLKLLSRYLDIAQSFPYYEPLPRLFINKIEKPRVQQLVRNLMSPTSSDFSLVNLVLEVWYGSSLLPQNFSKLKDLVDFVEAVMEIVPSNYLLAFSVCKLLSRGYNLGDGNLTGVLFWASSTLVSAIFHAIPVAPEYVWVEAAGILGDITGIESISERFYKRALSVYPFSIKLWKCYYKLSETKGDANAVVEAAREKGIELD
ncbi:hypothetical protein Q3G72_015369 [Acer saccharum]|nr:hypothetical protein Q3G72_015369 [Acer saccharum]